MCAFHLIVFETKKKIMYIKLKLEGQETKHKFDQDDNIQFISSINLKITIVRNRFFLAVIVALG